MSFKALSVLLVSSLFLMFGCASNTPPVSNVPMDWFDFGKQQALEGKLTQSELNLSEIDQSGYLNAALYNDYLQGYAEGKVEYCDQNARLLGGTGRPYLGICDDVNPTFKQQYDVGREQFWVISEY